MIEITNYRQGAILNCLHGVESENSLRINIEGISDHGCPVTVNGVAAQMDGRRFFCRDRTDGKNQHSDSIDNDPLWELHPGVDACLG